MSKFLKIQTPKWFAVERDSETTTLTIDGVIGGSYWDDESVEAKRFIQELERVTTSRIELHINSPGGDVFDGYRIYNALVAWSGAANNRELRVVVDGIAASIASVIAMAGDIIAMPEASIIMIHNPWSFTVGDAEDHRRAAVELETIGRQIAKIYADRTGQPFDVCRQMMTAETYIDAAEALEKGFATEIIENKQPVAACAAAAEIFGSTVPAEIIKKQKALRKRAEEKRLRDAGFSRAQARAQASGQCDAGAELIFELKNFIAKMKGF